MLSATCFHEVDFVQAYSRTVDSQRLQYAPCRQLHGLHLERKETLMSKEINVPLLDLKAQYETIRDEIEPVIREVVESQWFIMGPNVSDFETAVAKYCGTEHAVGVTWYVLLWR